MAPAPDLNDLIATVTADAAATPPCRLATASAVAGELADDRRRAGRPLRRRVPRRRAHLGRDQRVARRVAPGRPQAVLVDPPRPRALDAERAKAGARARRRRRAWPSGTPTSAPSTCCSGSSRPGGSAPRSSGRVRPHRGDRRRAGARPRARATTPDPPSRRSPRSPPRCSAARSPRRSRWATTTSAPSTCCSPVRSARGPGRPDPRGRRRDARRGARPRSCRSSSGFMKK